MRYYLHGVRVKFVYEGHRIKVKVTEAKNIENSYSRNVKLRSIITPVLSNIEPYIWNMNINLGIAVIVMSILSLQLVHFLRYDLS